MTAVLGRSDFTFADVKAQPTTVYLVLPPDRLATYARWLRLMLAQALTDLARAPASPARPVLFLLDEFSALGRLEPVERALGLMAGYGIPLWRSDERRVGTECVSTCISRWSPSH